MEHIDAQLEALLQELHGELLEEANLQFHRNYARCPPLTRARDLTFYRSSAGREENEHIVGCPQCAHTFDMLAREVHPSFERLLSRQASRLEQADQLAVTTHLGACASCLRIADSKLLKMLAGAVATRGGFQSFIGSLNFVFESAMRLPAVIGAYANVEQEAKGYAADCENMGCRVRLEHHGDQLRLSSICHRPEQPWKAIAVLITTGTETLEVTVPLHSISDYLAGAVVVDNPWFGEARETELRVVIVPIESDLESRDGDDAC